MIIIIKIKLFVIIILYILFYDKYNIFKLKF